jgi:amino acid transporter
MDTTLVQVSMFFTFLISLVTFVCSIVLLIKRKELKQGLIDSIFRIILMVLTTLILIIGIVSLLYMSGVPLKYAIVLVDYVTIAFIPISLITLGIFIYFFIVNRPKK